MTQRQSTPCAQCGTPFIPKTRNKRPRPPRFCSRACNYAAGGNLPKQHPLEERLWRGVTCGDGCWLRFTKARNPRTYSTIIDGDSRTTAQRISYRLAYGPFPDELDVLHHCDTPACIRPDHLFLGTQADNMRDKTAKGRQHRGEQIRQAKLTEAQVVEITRRWQAGESQYRLAAEFGVRQPAISRAVNRVRWHHVP